MSFDAGNPSSNGMTHVFDDDFAGHYTSYYRKKGTSVLSALCDLHGSDKGEVRSGDHPYPWPSHNYADYMENHFDHCRHVIANVFECGLGTNNPDIPSSMGANGRPGASLRVRRDYFSNARIVGADIDRDILFTEDRISTFHCDQTDPRSIAALWDNVPDIAFDLMIDDGLHTFEAGICLLENAFHKLREGGLYIIEDVTIPRLLQFGSYFAARDTAVEFVNLHRKGLPLGDNSLVVLRK